MREEGVEVPEVVIYLPSSVSFDLSVASGSFPSFFGVVLSSQHS